MCLFSPVFYVLCVISAKPPLSPLCQSPTLTQSPGPTPSHRNCVTIPGKFPLRWESVSVRGYRGVKRLMLGRNNVRGFGACFSISTNFPRRHGKLLWLTMGTARPTNVSSWIAQFANLLDTSLGRGRGKEKKNCKPSQWVSRRRTLSITRQREVSLYQWRSPNRRAICSRIISLFPMTSDATSRCYSITGWEPRRAESKMDLIKVCTPHGEAHLYDTRQLEALWCVTTVLGGRASRESCARVVIRLQSGR